MPANGKFEDLVTKEENAPELSSGEKCSIYCSNFRYALHHDDLWCNNTCGNWGVILSLFLVYYVAIAMFCWALIYAEAKHGVDTYYVYLGIFGGFVFFAAVAITMGQIERRKKEKANPEVSVDE